MNEWYQLHLKGPDYKYRRMCVLMKIYDFLVILIIINYYYLLLYYLLALIICLFIISWNFMYITYNH
jgi:hypothetical protein